MAAGDRADAAILPEVTVPIEADAGRGRAIKAAARRARRLGLTHIVTVDADRMPSRRQMAKFLAAATAGGDVIVIGRRDRLRAGWSVR